MSDSIVASTSLPEAFRAQVAARPKAVALRHHELGRWKEYTWSALSEQVNIASRALRGLGVVSGSRVAFVMSNQTSWIVIDLAILSLGAISIPLDPGFRPQTLTALLAATETSFVIVGDQEQFDKVRSDDAVRLRALAVVNTRGMGALADKVWIESDTSSARTAATTSGTTTATTAPATSLGTATETRGAEHSNEEVAWDQLVRATAATAVPEIPTLSADAPATIEVTFGPDQPIEYFIRSHRDLVQAADRLLPGVTLHHNDDLLAVASQTRPVERALTEVAWIRDGATLNIGVGGKVRELEQRQVQPTVLHLEVSDLNATADAITTQLGGRGYGPNAANRLLAKQPRIEVCRPSTNDLRVFRALIIGAITLGLAAHVNLRNTVGLLRVLLFFGLLAGAIAIALNTGVAIRPFVRKAFGLARTRLLITEGEPADSTSRVLHALQLSPRSSQSIDRTIGAVPVRIPPTPDAKNESPTMSSLNNAESSAASVALDNGHQLKNQDEIVR